MQGTLDRERMRRIHERMLHMRRFEETVVQLSQQGHSFGHFHLYIGQEATGAAVLEALADDFVLTTHRNHGHIVGRGADPGRALAEILGRESGLNRGRGGTLHMCDRARGFLSTSAVVGSVLPLAVGAAYTARKAGRGQVAVAFFGDGALEEGVSFEALNIASLWRLPVLFVCENNSPGALGQAAGEYPTSVIATPRLTDVSASLRIPSRVVDGGDAHAVYEAAQEAVAQCRAESGPAFIEAVTERWAGTRPLWPELATGVTELAMAWDDSLIGGPHQEWYRRHDPVLRYTRELLAREVLTRDEVLALDADVRQRMAAAAEFAANSPVPQPEGAAEGTFVPARG